MPEVAASKASIKNIKHTLQDLPLRLLFSASPPIRSLLDISCHPFQALWRRGEKERERDGERIRETDTDTGTGTETHTKKKRRDRHTCGAKT